MKFAAGLVAVLFTASTLASPEWTSPNIKAPRWNDAESPNSAGSSGSSRNSARGSTVWTGPPVDGYSGVSGAKVPGGKTPYIPTTYGSFREPKVPALPPKPTVPKTPKDGSTTSEDCRINPKLPHSAQHRGHWSPGYDINTDTTNSWPRNGKTVRQTFVITNTTLSPQGVPKQMLVVNGQYPGPPLIANWGDWIEVTVINKLKNNGTGIHWHGFRQLRTNLADGASGATDCPIAPGESRVYRFQAITYGTSWYHSHFSVQFGDGVVGPIIINGPSSANYDNDLGHVLITDYYDMTAPQADYFAHRRGPPTASNYLINGKNVAIDGSKGTRARFLFNPGQTHLLRLVNVGMDDSFKFSIDGHRLKVIQADFIPIIPYYTNEVSLSIGQRYHVIVEANQKPGNYYMRAMANLDCSPQANAGTGTANAIVSYLNALNQATLPSSTATNHTNTCVDEPIGSLTPIVTQAVDSTSFKAVAKVEAVNLNVVPEKRKRSPQGPGGGPPPPGGGPPPPGGGPPPPGGGGNILFYWTLGGVSQVLDWKNPIVSQAAKGNLTFDQLKNVVQLTQANVWTFWVIQNQFFVPHPMHLHGHDFNLLGQGIGVFNIQTDMDKLNFKNPPRRDVALLAAQGWTVIAFKTDNPGAWLLHCHIAWHAGEGLSLNFLERPQDIPALYGKQIKEEVTPSCKAWEKYEKTAVWVQYDSGLKRRAIDGTVDWAASKFMQVKERMYWSKQRNNMIRRRT